MNLRERDHERAASAPPRHHAPALPDSSCARSLLNSVWLTWLSNLIGHVLCWSGTLWLFSRFAVTAVSLHSKPPNDLVGRFLYGRLSSMKCVAFWVQYCKKAWRWLCMLFILSDSRKQQIPDMLTCSTDIMVIVTAEGGKPWACRRKKNQLAPDTKQWCEEEKKSVP